VDLIDNEENVYLELDGFHFEASSLQSVSCEKGIPHVVIKLPADWARKLRLIEPDEPLPFQLWQDQSD
jgi:hypothetical protein